MSQDEKFTLGSTETVALSTVSPAVADIMNRAHQWAISELERFAATETNPFLYYMRRANSTVASILGKTVNPEEMSRLIQMKEEYRRREASNDENYVDEKKDAA